LGPSIYILPAKSFHQNSLERGFLSGLLKKPKVNLHCDSTVPASLCAKAKEKVQKAYGKDKRWHKFKNGEILCVGLPSSFFM
jgi:hypothetical protein